MDWCHTYWNRSNLQIKTGNWSDCRGSKLALYLVAWNFRNVLGKCFLVPRFKRNMMMSFRAFLTKKAIKQSITETGKCLSPVLSWEAKCQSVFCHMEPVKRYQMLGSCDRTDGKKQHLWEMESFKDNHSHGLHQPLCIYLRMCRYNHSNVFDADPKVIILVVSRFFKKIINSF